MRYWNPFIEEALDRISRDGITELVVLPLYPQYSFATTAGSLNRMNEILGENGRSKPGIKLIKQWHDDPTYIAALTRTVSDELAKFPIQDPAHSYSSAHSVRSAISRAPLPGADKRLSGWCDGKTGKPSTTYLFSEQFGLSGRYQPMTLRRLATA
jgi:protoheme ferro-lyase